MVQCPPRKTDPHKVSILSVLVKERFAGLLIWFWVCVSRCCPLCIRQTSSRGWAIAGNPLSRVGGLGSRCRPFGTVNKSRTSRLGQEQTRTASRSGRFRPHLHLVDDMGQFLDPVFLANISHKVSLRASASWHILQHAPNRKEPRLVRTLSRSSEHPQ
jgi:hypothetical protein